VAPGGLFAGELTGIRLSSGPLATRVVLDLDKPAEHELFELSNPSRIVIDLPGMTASSSLRLPVPKGRVRSVRTGTQSGGVLRVVFDLSERAEPSSFPLLPEGGFGHRVVVDLSSASRGSNGPTTVQRSEDTIIAIDAGHGGRDPGTSGHGAREKDVVLQIARQLAELVDAQRGFKAVMIRDRDSFIELNERVRRAHEAQADFFISIHADSNDNRNVSGAAVYSIDTGRAASEAAKRLADRENAADLIGGARIADQEDDIARIMLEMTQSASISKSLTAGGSIISQLARITTVRKSKVQPGRFLVLTSPDIPSLLVETAFMSNPRDAANLRDPAFQKLLAHALFGGIVDFFRANPPPGTYIARNPPPESRPPIRHVIASGETLSEIAERYRISLSELRRSNAINGDVIRIGQVLTIPTTG
jgi:N-acetylmuramoyl-L-alanine amidase